MGPMFRDVQLSCGERFSRKAQNKRNANTEAGEVTDC
jgi:hypothetical protein